MGLRFFFFEKKKFFSFFFFLFSFFLRQTRQGASPNRECITASTVSVYNTNTSQMKKSQTNVNKTVKQYRSIRSKPPPAEALR